MYLPIESRNCREPQIKEFFFYFLWASFMHEIHLQAIYAPLEFVLDIPLLFLGRNSSLSFRIFLSLLFAVFLCYISPMAAPAASIGVLKTTLLVFVVVSSFELCSGARELAALYQPPAGLMSYHEGVLLDGELPLSILWYGRFTTAQKSIVSDFILSLSRQQGKAVNSVSPVKSHVSDWWKMVETYTKLAKRENTHITLSGQFSDEIYSLGKTLKRAQISELAGKASHTAKVTLVLTDATVTVEGFCMNNCGFHGVDSEKKSALVWVGNSETQCPGYCAWPFHQPLYGPQSPPLLSPNNDVGVDGMIINIAGLLASTVTNPFNNGYFQGPAEAPLEAASACSGLYGKGAYPGYAGELLMDSTTGASYNAQGVNGRKYLLPALFNPTTSSCSTLV
ncbi:protein PHOSPHATE-INDUCED 1-like [Aristolochia californica]|uniref:protein PHOSPHATE-INDUCED 1-like n=1 Tax=Aristolochia californica TaxID=171875 RepID=UPI0035DA107C